MMTIFSLLCLANLFSNDNVNLIPNGDFSKGKVGELPSGWVLDTKHPGLAPRFSKVEKKGQSFLLIQASGQPDIVGGVKATINIPFGKTYLFTVRFKMSKEINPQKNLLFQCYGPVNFDGIFDFVRKEDGYVEGSSKITMPGEGAGLADIRIILRFCTKGSVMVKNISLSESVTDPPRWVKVGCTSGFTSVASIPSIVERSAALRTDLLLFPEFMNGPATIETIDGPSCRLLSQLAAKHRMYIAGGIVRRATEHRVYNTAVLFDRNGKLIATYDKIHPSSPEVNEMGISPGTKVVVTDTDFGRIGFMTCYDSWFTDVIELNALRGAEIVLFPNAGYYRSIMTARAADNGVRILSSSLYNDAGIWDTGGRDIQNPDQDTTSMLLKGETFKDVVLTKVDSVTLLTASLDLNFSPQPHYNNGTMFSAPAGRRNKREQVYYLDEDIKNERTRWWKE